MKKLTFMISAMLMCIVSWVSALEQNEFARVTDPAALGAKDTIILATSFNIDGTDYIVAAGDRDNKKLTPITEGVTVTAESAVCDAAMRLVLDLTSDGFTLTPLGKTKPLAETGSNDFADANTKNNRYWEFVADGTNGVYVHNLGNTDAYVKWHVGNNIIRPYKAGSVGAYYLYVFVRKYVEPASVHPAAVALDKTSLDLYVGDSETLTATVTPANAGNKKVTWSSSDESVATVSSKGEVTAVAEGKATITVTTQDGGLTATCTVNVAPKPLVNVTGIELSKTTLTLNVGASATLKATVTPEDATNKNVTWTSSDAAIASVDEGGVVKALAEGLATITATTVDGGFAATCALTVKAYAGEKGTKDNPYTVAEVIELNNSQAVNAWVVGYIWGQPASASSLKPTPADDTSIALGDAEEDDGSGFIPVQLPTSVRSEIGLSSHPTNVGRGIKVYGKLEKYFGVPGVKNVSDYVWLDEQTALEETIAEEITFSNGTIAAEGLIEVYNITGQRISSGFGTVDMTAMSQGLYVIKSGERTVKVVK